MGKKQEQYHSYNVDIKTEMQTQSRPPPQYVHSPPQENWFPWLVPLIFLIDVGIFVYTMYVNNCPATTNEECVFPSLGRFSFQPMSQNPLLGPSIDTLTRLGALGWKQVVMQGEAWRLLTCMWLHAGVIHLVANMMSLLFVGIRIEQEFGFSKIGPLFVLSGFGGSLLSSIHLKSELTMSVGASGALFGLLGAMLSELITNWTIYANKCAALMTLVFVIVLNLGVSILPHVDSSAHIGGFLSGFLLGFILLIRPQFGWVSSKYMPPGYDMSYAKSKYKIYQYFLCVLALILLGTGYAYGLAKLFNVQTISKKQ